MSTSVADGLNRDLTVSGLVRRNDDVLLVRTPTRGWEMPGGFVDGTDTTCAAALAREVLEESNCEAMAQRLLLVTERTTAPRVVNMVYACAYLSGSPKAGMECVDAGWFKPVDALAAVTYWPAQLRLACCLGKDYGTVGYVAYEETAINEYRLL